MPYNPTFDLTHQQIENSYQQVSQYDTGSSTFYNGVGQSITVTSTSSSFASSASFMTLYNPTANRWYTVTISGSLGNEILLLTAM